MPLTGSAVVPAVGVARRPRAPVGIRESVSADNCGAEPRCRDCLTAARHAGQEAVGAPLKTFLHTVSMREAAGASCSAQFREEV